MHAYRITFTPDGDTIEKLDGDPPVLIPEGMTHQPKTLVVPVLPLLHDRREYLVLTKTRMIPRSLETQGPLAGDDRRMLQRQRRRGLRRRGRG